MFLQDLLGIGGPPDVSQAPAPPTQLPPEVEAFLMNQSRPPMAPSGPAPSNAPTVEQAPSSGPVTATEDEIVANGRPPYERKGMFGIKGTLRDVLGSLGDAFLLQGGADRIYGPRRDQEKQADALRGFTEDPMGSIEELNRLGYADVSRELYKDHSTIDNNRRRYELDQRKFQQDIVNDEALNRSRAAGAEKNVLGNIRSSLSGIAGIKDPAARELAYQRRKQYIEQYISEYGTPEMAEIVRDTLPASYREGVEKLFIDQQTQERLVDADDNRDAANARAAAAQAAADRRAAASQAAADRRQRERIEYDKTKPRRGGKRSFNFPAPPEGF